MTDYIDTWKIANEIATKLRNADILTTSERGVTTETDSGTWTGTGTHTISRSNVRNIRAITVDGSPLSFGADYEVDYTYDNSGTTECRITFTSDQTGSYEISYDYGLDKIHVSINQGLINLSEYPRVAVEMMPSTTIPGGHGNVNETTIYFEVIVRDTSQKKIESIHAAARAHFIDNQTGYHYLKVVKPHSNTGIIPAPVPNAQNKLMQKNAEYVSKFNYEKN